MPESTQLTAADESSVVPEGRRAQIVAGVTDSFSAGLGIFPFGIALGLLVIQLGLPWWVAPALSLSAFAGSLELLLVGMITSTAPLAAIAVTVFVVNFRHVFYAFSFPRHLVRNRFARLYATYSMIDEGYAVNAALPRSQQSAARILGMQAACQIYWVGGGLAGVLIAGLLPGPIKGLEFALCALLGTGIRARQYALRLRCLRPVRHNRVPSPSCRRKDVRAPSERGIRLASTAACQADTSAATCHPRPDVGRAAFPSGWSAPRSSGSSSG
jgi:4-azaleucine resistance transporter AzlC